MSTANEYVEYMVQMAAKRLDKGIINEPRVYFDQISDSAVNELAPNFLTSSPSTFRNAERFPVRITHMVASQARLESDNDVSPRGDNTAGLRIRMRDHSYNQKTGSLGITASQELPAVYTYNNTAAGTDPASALSQASWRFTDWGEPFVLHARDSLEIEVNLTDPEADITITTNQVGPVTAVINNPLTLAVTFLGYGLQSMRPYALTSNVQRFEDTSTFLQVDDFRNDGDEPIVVTQMSAAIIGPLVSPVVSTDLRRLIFNVRQVGSGTNVRWFQGPIDPTVIALMPADLVGCTTKALTTVHRFPYPLLWEPGGGVDVDLAITPNNNGFYTTAFLGHIMVT